MHYKTGIITVCKAEDCDRVGSFVRREVYPFCAREDIRLLEEI